MMAASKLWNVPPSHVQVSRNKLYNLQIPRAKVLSPSVSMQSSIWMGPLFKNVSPRLPGKNQTAATRRRINWQRVQSELTFLEDKIKKWMSELGRKGVILFVF
jgi:hypothetical protein